MCFTYSLFATRAGVGRLPVPTKTLTKSVGPFPCIPWQSRNRTQRHSILALTRLQLPAGRIYIQFWNVVREHLTSPMVGGASGACLICVKWRWPLEHTGVCILLLYKHVSMLNHLSLQYRYILSETRPYKWLMYYTKEWMTFSGSYYLCQRMETSSGPGE